MDDVFVVRGTVCGGYGRSGANRITYDWSYGCCFVLVGVGIGLGSGYRRAVEVE